MLKRLLSLLLVFSFTAKFAYADHVFRVEGGAFNGRIARTESGNTVPFNAPAGAFYGAEIEYGSPRWRFMLGGNYYDYKVKTVSVATVEQSQITYGDVRLGAVLASACCEARLIYSRAQIPYTDAPDVNTLIPRTVFADFLRGEAILYARAANYKLAFMYFVQMPVTQIDYPGTGGGTMSVSYDLGGCARIFLGGEKFKYGPSICINLEEMYLPNSVLIFRQEVHARLAVEF